MALFDMPVRAGKEADNKIAKKANSKTRQTATVKGGSSLIDKIAAINALVEKNLGHLKDDYIIIKDQEVLHNYINKCIENNVISIDTETTGLDPMLDDIVGICIYTPNMQAAYIPVNHISYITGVKVEGQLPVDILKTEFERVVGIDTIMFNADFDTRFMKHRIGVTLHCTWDCYLAARCLNENEPVNKLKPLHNKYVLNGEGDAFSFDDLFKGITFDKIPIKTGYIYAAHDAIITYELYEYQKPFLTADNEECIKRGLQDVAWVFHNIEMPCVDAVVELEDTGVEFDFEYNKKLKDKYHKLLDEKEAKFHEICEMYSEEISNYRGSVKLDNPINIASPQQLAVLLYDIAKCPLYYDKKQKQETRSTAEDALTKLDSPIAKAVLDYREFATIVSTFIDKLPECVYKDGRIHCTFNQYGADTGRFSSKEPNMQNIPSHNKDIRKMFKATDGYVFLSADYSQQEVKGMAQMCGDEGMIEAFRQGKDFYAEIASVAFNLPYNECLEHFPKGSYIKQYSGKWHYGTESDYDKIADGEKDEYADGKERRAQAKSILLGINYGRGAASIAEQLGCSKKEAEKIKDLVFKGFPAIAEFERQSYDMVNSLGYITTLWGRKRRLPSMLKPDYDFEWEDGLPFDENPLDFDSELSTEVPMDIQEKYRKKLANCNFRDRKKIFEQANAEGIYVIDNTKDKDYTKVVNARIQGTAADMTKLAMIALYNNKRLKELGFRMLIQVHDEIIAECPKENAKEVVELFSKVMSEAPGERFIVPISCDVEVTDRWYGEKLNI